MNSNNDHDPNEDRVPNGAGAHGKGKEEDIGEDDVFHRMLMTDEDVHERTRGSGVARWARSGVIFSFSQKCGQGMLRAWRARTPK